jgi:hypothetical protein
MGAKTTSFLVLVVELLRLSIAESGRERSVMLNESSPWLLWRLTSAILARPRPVACLPGCPRMHCDGPL